MDTTVDGLTAVQRVSLLGLRLRALDARSSTPILGDDAAVEVARALGVEVDRPRVPRSVVLVHAVRARMIDAIVRRFVSDHPTAVVLDLGCGLDTRWGRVAPPSGVDWYDVDLPAVAGLRERVVPAGTTVIGADVTRPGWLHDLPRDRPAIAVTDGLLALLGAADFIAMARSLTAHVAVGEFAFNAYSRRALRNGRRVPARNVLSLPIAGEGVDDPHEVESWGAGLSLVGEHFMARAPEVSLFPPALRLMARMSARSDRLSRAADRIVHYRYVRAG